MTRPWTQFSHDETLEFLNAVRPKDSEDFRVLFEPSICEVYRHSLPFYDGYDLIRIVNKYSPPFVLLDYLSNGENHYYLDGSDAALQNVCAQNAMSLGTDNALSYIDLYLSYVYERGNSLVYIDDPQNTRQRGADAMAVHFQAIQQYHNAHITKKGDNFQITTPLLYQGKSVQSRIDVNKKGRIAVKEPIKVQFLDKPNMYEAIPFIHPKEKQIIEQCKTLLAKTQSGKRMIDVLETCKVELQIIANPNIQIVTYNKPAISLFMPAAMHTADYHQALLLAAAINDVEQIMRGYKRPSIDEDDEIYLTINYDKNLKALLEMIKIIDEFKNQGNDDALVTFRRFGFQELYAAAQQDKSMNEMMMVYLRILADQGYIREAY